MGQLFNGPKSISHRYQSSMTLHNYERKHKVAHPLPTGICQQCPRRRGLCKSAAWSTQLYTAKPTHLCRLRPYLSLSISIQDLFYCPPKKRLTVIGTKVGPRTAECDAKTISDIQLAKATDMFNMLKLRVIWKWKE